MSMGCAMTLTFGEFGSMIGHLLGGVDKNPLTVVYSVFLALWSTLFLESWSRLENELKFQWG